MRWGLAGYGDLSEKRLGSALQTSGNELVSVWGRQIEKTRAFALRHNVAVAARSIDELLAGIDAVYIATPVATHVDIATAALIAGKHVLIEKPVSPNVANADGLISLARSHGLRAGVAYYRRLFPALQHVREIFQQRSDQLRHVDVIHTTPFSQAGNEPKAFAFKQGKW